MTNNTSLYLKHTDTDKCYKAQVNYKKLGYKLY